MLESVRSDGGHKADRAMAGKDHSAVALPLHCLTSKSSMKKQFRPGLRASGDDNELMRIAI